MKVIIHMTTEEAKELKQYLDAHWKPKKPKRKPGRPRKDNPQNV